MGGAYAPYATVPPSQRGPGRCRTEIAPCNRFVISKAVRSGRVARGGWGRARRRSIKNRVARVALSGCFVLGAVAKEPVDIGGRTVTAVKVELREVSNVDSTDILGRCIHEQVEGDVEWTTQGTPDPDEGDHRLPRLHMDPGCEGDFVHRKVGYEWWYANVLVKEEATYYRVEIQDFGYEWLEWQGSKVLRTSQVKTANAAAARPFVQFTVTTEKVAWQVTGWETLDFEAY